ncbi:Uncharacterised protein [uncultured archaeon]|nr:Uncharacterised protein [uncultured archaeon]
MRKKTAGEGEMPVNDPSASIAPVVDNAQIAQEAQIENAPAAENAPIEVEGSGKQPEFRVVQPEYSMRDNKTIFKDVGALWKNVSQKTGKEFYTLKIGKMRLLVFRNQKMAQQ